ncbi:uncharacterized protein EI97DRAFT_140403 [Westerdykella ornata]|uniref:Uncharacterized protein n=1 Tax=Westerdykella ornata TaxID=318751 RepID=A0A6A6JFK3_WESOR|nr:uncharacterized protein EI97DRAFT_140403 [Westerdykella ornata]KAF2273969.1 hypothetical protein EI97DRAFT_140403 [Westerdykella ornata]
MYLYLSVHSTENSLEEHVKKHLKQEPECQSTIKEQAGFLQHRTKRGRDSFWRMVDPTHESQKPGVHAAASTRRLHESAHAVSQALDAGIAQERHLFESRRRHQFCSEKNQQRSERRSRRIPGSSGVDETWLSTKQSHAKRAEETQGR